MGSIYTELYRLPLGVTLLAMAVLGAVWSLGLRQRAGASRRTKTAIGIVLAGAFLLWAGVVLHMTVFSRAPGLREVHREAFYQLRELFRGGPRELVRTLWMNVCLFVPGGLLLEALWPGKLPGPVRFFLTAALLAGFSVGIEAVQYRYALGCVEADDVLCNLLGAVLGAGIHEAARSFSERIGTKQRENRR